MYFQILGDLQIADHDHSCHITAPKPRQVLAILALNANRSVATPALVHELWGDDPPPSVATTLQTYVFQLRLALSETPTYGGDRSAVRQLLVTRPSGYSLQTGPDDIDLTQFQRLCRAGREASREQRFDRAAECYASALGLWRGDALTGVPHGPLLASSVRDLTEQRLGALEARIDADLALGRHRHVIGELVALTMEHPMHEALHGQLMTALSGAGRRSEALQVYRRLRERLVDEVGLEPSGELQRMHAELLVSDCFSRDGLAGPVAI